MWNLRLGYIGDKDLKELKNQDLLEKGKLNDLSFVEDCVLGKPTMVSFKTATHQAKQTLYYIHFDLWGPSRVASHTGARYFYL